MAEGTEDHQVSLVLYCEKLTSILKEDTDKVWWALSMLVDQTIGEVSAIAFVAGFDVYAQPKDEPAKLLSELPELLQSMGLSLWRDGSDYLETVILPMNWNRWRTRRLTGGWMFILEAAACRCSSTTT